MIGRHGVFFESTALAFTCLVLAFYGPAAQATEKSVGDLVARAFAKRHVTGAFALLRKTGNGSWQQIVLDGAATEPQIPASTFKIVNTLIGLETGVIRAGEVFPWDGKPRELKAWEQDLTLAQAIKVSCVPCFQDVARRIGAARMQPWLTKLAYGNATLGTVVDRFWLDGPLVIAPAEQVRFLRRLYDGELPIARQHQDIVKRLLLVEEAARYRLFAKTGWAKAVEPNVGWYVGWVEAGDAVYVFATMVKLGQSQAPLMATVRRDVTLDILGALGLPLATQ